AALRRSTPSRAASHGRCASSRRTGSGNRRTLRRRTLAPEVSLFISPPNVELHISNRAIKERRLPSRRHKHTAIWRPPLDERHRVQFLHSQIASVGRDGSPSRPKNEAKFGTHWKCVPTTFRRSQKLSLTFVR